MRAAIALVAAAIAAPAGAIAAPVIETTFDCADWDQSLGLADSVVCASGDGIGGHGGWSTASGRLDQITVEANNPASAGKGFRHWRGDGMNNNGGGLGVTIPATRELWLRFTMRYQAGFAWATAGQPHYTKDLYMNVGGTTGNFVLGFESADRWGLTMVNPGTGSLRASPGWQTINGGSTGDGRFHCYEAHVKFDSNGADGIAESWVDGVPNHSVTNHDFGTTGSWTYFALGENQNAPANGGDFYTDYDDLAVSLTERIGCPGVAPGGDAGADDAGAGGPDPDAGIAADGRGSGGGCSTTRSTPDLATCLAVLALVRLAGRRRRDIARSAVSRRAGPRPSPPGSDGQERLTGAH